MNNSYKIGDKQIHFSEKEYLSKSLNITRDLMPQVNFEEFLKYKHLIDKYIRISKLYLPASILKPIQCEINLSKVIQNISKKEQAKDKLSEIFVPRFICSNDLHIIDGHHSHVEILMTDPHKQVEVFVLDLTAQELYTFFSNLTSFLNEYKNIKDEVIAESQNVELFDENVFFSEIFENYFILSEDYGMQGPESVPGMGTVDYGTPSTADSAGTKGSGDFASKPLLVVQKKNEHNFITVDKLKEIAKRINKKNKEKLNESLTDEQKELEEKNKIIEDNHYPKDLPDEIKQNLKYCINKVVLKKYIEIDKDFSCETMEGIVQCKAGDVLMVGVDGEIYPINKEIFEQTYLKV